MNKDIRRANYVIKTLMAAKCPSLVNYSVVSTGDGIYEIRYSPEGLISLSKFVEGLNTSMLGFGSYTRLLGALRAICEAVQALSEWYLDYSDISFDKDLVYLNENGTKAYFVLTEQSQSDRLFIDCFSGLLEDLKEEYENIESVESKISDGKLYSPRQVLRILSSWQLEITGIGVAKA